MERIKKNITNDKTKFSNINKKHMLLKKLKKKNYIFEYIGTKIVNSRKLRRKNSENIRR